VEAVVVKVFSENRKARFLYHVEETFEAGMLLLGSEVKSIIAGQMDLSGAYVHFQKDGLYLRLAKVTPWGHDPWGAHEIERPRKLLLNRSEIQKIRKAMERKGLACVPLRCFYSPTMKIKLEIAICTGRNKADKRSYLKDRDANKEMRSAIRG
jgi:SsrA-binding protein